MDEKPGNPLGLIDDGAIAIAEGKILRVGRRTELAGFRAKEVVALGGAWVSPGLIDCHTHLVFAGTRADEHAMRRAGASYEEIARAGGGIRSTVKLTSAASDEHLLEQSRRRLHALMRGGCTTIEVKSGYGLNAKNELRLLKTVAQLADKEAVRLVPTLLALHALPPDQHDRRNHYIGEIVDKLIPKVAAEELATSVDAFCDAIAFTPDEVERVFKAAAHHGLATRLHAEQLSNQHGAALAARYHALSADHLEHLDEAGAKAMAAAGTVAVLLPGAYYALQEKRKPPVALLRKNRVPIAVATDCNPGTSPLLSPSLAMNMACTLFELTPEEAIAGMTINAARALGLAHTIGSIAPGKQADLAVWRIESLSELGYWIGLPGPERRIFAGRDSPR